MNNQILDGIRLALFDLDGTIYLGDQPISGAIDALKRMRQAGIEVVFLTNNSSKDRALYSQKLVKMGMDVGAESIISSTIATAEYLVKNHAGKTVYPVGNDAFVAEIERYGIKCSEDADIVLLAYDTTLTYKKLNIAHNLLLKGREYIATHPDFVCPSEEGSMPDVGSFIALLKASSGREPSVVVGKPHKAMAQAIEGRFDYKKSQILMVGDRLYTDIAFGVNNGYRTVLCLSGETTAQMAQKSTIKADFTLPDVTYLMARTQ